MFLAEPPRTQWDLNFQVLGFPVRVHPLFWLIGLLLGFNGGESAGVHLLIWFIALFISILVHELGHALMMRRFGRQAHIVLYAMGGLAIEGRPRDSASGFSSFEPYTDFQPRARTPNEQILISAAGPGIQFLFAALIVAGIYATGGSVKFDGRGLIPIPIPVLGGELASNPNIRYLIAMFLWVNIFWPLLNLVPVLPLDGGQIAMQVLIQQDPWGGTQRALWLSVFAGGGMAAFGLLVMNDMFMMMLFASLAVSCYMTLQQMGGGRGRW